jgi:hypothetical protein
MAALGIDTAAGLRYSMRRTRQGTSEIIARAPRIFFTHG